MRPGNLVHVDEIEQTTNSRNVPIAVRLLPLAAWMGLIFFPSRSHLPQPLGPDLTAVAGHVAVYALLAALLWWGLAIRPFTPGWRLGLSFAIAVAYGLSDEWHQSFVPGRMASVIDLVTDGCGALLGLAGVTLWTLAR